MMYNNNQAKHYESEQQPKVENAAQEVELQCETEKTGLLQKIGDHKGMAAGIVLGAAVVTAGIVYRKKIWGWVKKPFTKKQAAEETAADPKNAEEQK
jgi:hypothetical protein